MVYGREFRENWRAWVGAALGLSVGAGTQAYSNSLFAPHMVAEFGWDRAVFALQGTLSIFMFMAIPFVGRLTDLFGARRIAAVGVVALPAAYVAFSLQTGSITMFFILSIAKMMIGALTASLVYCRVVALNFRAARGLALAICASAPALLMAILAPVIGAVIAGYGWRAGYQALAGLALVLGMLAVVILPPHKAAACEPAEKPQPSRADPPRRNSRRDYADILRSQTFWIVFGGMFLCNLPNVLMSSQFGLMLMEQGVALKSVPWMISIYGTSVVIGRFVCGIALDHISSHAVAATSMAMPAIGLLGLGLELEIPAMIVGCIIFVGLAQGAEGDLVAYIVARYFPPAIYGSVAGLIGSGLALSSSLGALTLSLILHQMDAFKPFLLLTATTTLMGALLFVMLGRRKHFASMEAAAPV